MISYGMCWPSASARSTSRSKELAKCSSKRTIEKEQTKANLGKRRQMARKPGKGIMDALESTRRWRRRETGDRRMSVWQLGIDFGTSYTVAAVATEGTVTVVDVESNGRSRMPSSVFISPDGEILVGTAAQHQAVFAPERYEPTPKRALGEGDCFLGDDLVPVTDLVAAVLRRVYTEASRQQGESAPNAVFVTHPADWGETRLDVLREAIEQADLSGYSLVAEPVAAAARIGLSATAPGQFVAVYDFGGGTFDAAVLRRTPDGFDVAGPPAGRDPLGGEDVDQRIIDYLGEVLSGDDPEKWALLAQPDRRQLASERRRSTHRGATGQGDVERGQRLPAVGAGVGTRHSTHAGRAGKAHCCRH